MAKLGVIGAGSWGTALAILLNENGNEVTLWSHRETEAEQIRSTRQVSKLPKVRLPEAIQVTSDLEAASAQKDILILVVPSHCVRETAKKMSSYVEAGTVIVSASKGIEESTLASMTDIVSELIPQSEAAVLSGPSHAEEVAKGLPTTCVVGARCEKTARYLQQIFMSPVFRVYISPDMIGFEIGGGLKIVMSLDEGIVVLLCYV